jgi:hypothetical protein
LAAIGESPEPIAIISAEISVIVGRIRARLASIWCLVVGNGARKRLMTASFSLSHCWCLELDRG